MTPPLPQSSPHNLAPVEAPLPQPQPMEILPHTLPHALPALPNPSRAATASPLTINYNGSASLHGAHSSSATSTSTHIPSHGSMPDLQHHTHAPGPGPGPGPAAVPARSTTSPPHSASALQLRACQRLDDMAARLAALESTVAQLPARLDALLQRHAAQQQAALEAAMQRRAAAHGSYAADVLDAVARVSAAHAMTAAPPTAPPAAPPTAPPAAPPPTALPGGSARGGAPPLALPSFTNRTKTFTLNPNGIKKRRRNGAAPGAPAGPAPRHNAQDIAADVLGLPLGMPSANPAQGNAPAPAPNAIPSAAAAQSHPHGSPLPLALQMPLPLGMPVQVAVPAAMQGAGGAGPGVRAPSAGPGHPDLVGVNASAAPNATNASADTEGKPALPEQERGVHHDTPDLVEEDGYQEDDESEHVVLPGPAVLPPGAKSAGTGIDTGTEPSHSEEEYDEYEEEMEADGNFEEDEVDEDLERGGAKHAAKKRVVGKRRVKRPLPKDASASAAATAPGAVAAPDSDINYTLLKAPNNVRTIWEEYVYGIGAHPSIRGLEEKYGNKWRLTKNRKTFSRRKRLYKFILAGIDRGRTADEMIRALEEKRLYKDENGEVKRRTIGWLQQSLTGI